jgi:uncharacterized protein DUF6690
MLGMFGKPGWVLVLLAAAFVVPYVAFDKNISGAVDKALGRGKPDVAAESAGEPEPDAANAPAAAALPQQPPVPQCDLASAFRLDVTPQWVTATWPKVTTVVADTSFAGMRVPLVTGVMPDDVVGTLTYYFDDQQRARRITFSGSTADPRRLVAVITSQYRLPAQPTLDAGLYQSKWNGKVISSLHVRHASVLSTGAAHGNYDVQLDLNRADALAGTASAPRRLFGW